MTASPSSSFRRFAVHGVVWREYLDWAVLNFPIYILPVLLVFMTSFFFFFAGPARRAIVRNLAVVLPGSSRPMNYLRAWRVLYNFAWTITEGAKFKLTRGEFSYDIEGGEFLDQLAGGAGAIVLTAHMGSYDLGAAIFAEKFQRSLRMVRAPEPHAESEKHLQETLARTGSGAVKVDYNTGGPMLSFDLLSALRDGEIVSIQGDRVIPGLAQAEGELFGQRVLFPSGPFTLALVADVPIHPLFFIRDGWRRYRIIARAPIVLRRTGRAREIDLAPGLTSWCAVLEETVARHWEQWFALLPIFAADAKR